MTGVEIIRRFKERVNRTPKRNLTTKLGYYAFCEELSRKTYPEMKADDRLRARSLALAGSKLFG